jgi:hypothetical protein
MKPFWPLGTSPLPLEDAPDDSESENLTIDFHVLKFGRVEALVFDENRFVIDVVVADDFRTCYDVVSRAYPRASWSPE